MYETSFGCVAYLVDHHDCKQVANGCEEEAVEEMLYVVANSFAEDVQDNLTNDEEEYAE